jgi:deoxyribose-phosphate aldolase
VSAAVPTRALPADLAAACASAEALQAFLADLPSTDDAALVARAEELAIVPDDPAVRARWIDVAIGLVDLTSLEAGDTPARVRELARTGLQPDADDPDGPHVAAVCVYPDLAADVAAALAGSAVRVASVAGAFPSSRSPLAVKVTEVGAAVAAGADEIDCVLDRGAFLDGREFDAFEQLVAIVAAAGDVHVKVILESGALPDLDAVRRAAWLSFLAGADVVKTSTGKDGPGASLPAVLTMLEVAREVGDRTGRVTGVKASGGIRTTEEALAYLALVTATVGESWLVPDRFRFGASSLLAALVADRR